MILLDEAVKILAWRVQWQYLFICTWALVTEGVNGNVIFRIRRCSRQILCLLNRLLRNIVHLPKLAPVRINTAALETHSLIRATGVNICIVSLEELSEVFEALRLLEFSKLPLDGIVRFTRIPAVRGDLALRTFRGSWTDPRLFDLREQTTLWVISHLIL